MGNSCPKMYNRMEPSDRMKWSSAASGAVIGLSFVLMVIASAFVNTSQPMGGLMANIVTPTTRILLQPSGGAHNIWGFAIPVWSNEVLPVFGNALPPSDGNFYEGTVVGRFGVLFPVIALMIAQGFGAIIAFVPFMIKRNEFMAVYDANANWYWELVRGVTMPVIELTLLAVLGVQEVAYYVIFITLSSLVYVIRILELRRSGNRYSKMSATNFDLEIFWLAVCIEAVLWSTILYFSVANSPLTIDGTPALIGGPVHSSMTMASAVVIAIILNVGTWVFIGLAETTPAPNDRMIYEILHISFFTAFVVLTAWLTWSSML